MIQVTLLGEINFHFLHFFFFPYCERTRVCTVCTRACLVLKITLCENNPQWAFKENGHSGAFQCSSRATCNNKVNRHPWHFFSIVMPYLDLLWICASVARCAWYSKTQQIDKIRGKALLSAFEEKSLRYFHEPVIGRKSLWIWPITGSTVTYKSRV